MHSSMSKHVVLQNNDDLCIFKIKVFGTFLKVWPVIVLFASLIIGVYDLGTFLSFQVGYNTMISCSADLQKRKLESNAMTYDLKALDVYFCCIPTEQQNDALFIASMRYLHLAPFPLNEQFFVLWSFIFHLNKK